MTQSSATGTAVEFGVESFIANAANYRANKKIVDAASGYDNVEDAIRCLKAAWEAMEVQAKEGSGYTPKPEVGFGSDSAAVIAETILGRRTTPGTTRKLFSGLGK
jgi:hypothetical protein